MRFSNNRLLKDYFRSQNLIKQSSPRFLQDVFIFFILFVFLIWLLPSPGIALLVFAVIFAFMIFRRYKKGQREFIRLKKACFQKIAVREYLKRLEKVSPDVLLDILQEEIRKKFQIYKLKVNNGMLEGRLLGEKIAVVYLDSHGEGVVTKREVLSVIRKCLHLGFTQVRIFTNGDFATDLSDFEQYPEVNLRLYNGDKLQYLLKNTYLFPSVSQIKDLINSEIKRRKKRSMIKTEIMKKKKYTVYFFYSLLLFLMAWGKLGVVYLNLIAGSILLGFALTNIIQSFRVREIEIEPEVYFQRKGF